ncbi:hypothetical protein ABZS71_13095 [Streptomyces sp. NPDC005393]|uniref:hypothetical protein n=1 Tax=Streptomyces sp. NPDC005393 TaxID=3157041 RepID=UPI0033ACDE06
MTSARYDTRPVGSCLDCFAWGPLWWYGRCTACYAFRRLHYEGKCGSCRRHIAVKQRYCRLCWREAHRRVNIDRITTGAGIPHCGPLAPFLQQIDCHQLVFVTDYFLSNLFSGHNATLDRLRADRWLDEALDRGPDPLHLAAVFDISTATAIRYANAARSILEPDPEQQPP